MKIKEIIIEGLFGQFNHKIPLNNSNVTMIHAPNGFGKTTVLNLISSILTGKNLQLIRTPFSRLEVIFDNNTKLEITKKMEHNSDVKFKIPKPLFTFKYTTPDGNIKYHTSSGMSTKVLTNSMVSIITEEIPFLKRVGPRIWLNKDTGDHYDMDDVVENFGFLLPQENNIEDWLRKIRSQSVHFISSNRLLQVKNSDRFYVHSVGVKESKDPLIPSVKLYSEEISKAIESKLAESAALSQELDRTFPTRVIKGMESVNDNETLSEELISKKLVELEEKRKRLNAVGLLEHGADIPFQSENRFNAYTRRVLSLYIEDTEKKLAIFDELEIKINFLLEIINKRFKRKQMFIDKKSGFTFRLLTDGSNLSPEKLSSGEQHTLVLYYDLLFKSKHGSLVLIDEPEISLHIGWQEKFLNDLLKISEMTGIYVIIATHSPDIIGGRWDLTVGLEEVAE